MHLISTILRSLTLPVGLDCTDDSVHACTYLRSKYLFSICSVVWGAAPSLALFVCHGKFNIEGRVTYGVNSRTVCRRVGLWSLYVSDGIRLKVDTVDVSKRFVILVFWDDGWKGVCEQFMMFGLEFRIRVM